MDPSRNLLSGPQASPRCLLLYDHATQVLPVSSTQDGRERSSSVVRQGIRAPGVVFLTVRESRASRQRDHSHRTAYSKGPDPQPVARRILIRSLLYGMRSLEEVPLRLAWSGREVRVSGGAAQCGVDMTVQGRDGAAHEAIKEMSMLTNQRFSTSSASPSILRRKVVRAASVCTAFTLAACTSDPDSDTDTDTEVVDLYTIGVTVSGLTGSGLVLQNNNSVDALTVDADGTSVFGTAQEDGSAYSVTVFTQPTNPSQACTVTDGSGTVSGADVEVAVTCATDEFTVGGTVSGLTRSGVVVLQNNAGDDLSVSADGDFVFALPVTDGAAFDVSVLADPDAPSQTCSVTDGSGTIAGANVVTVDVDCVDAYSEFVYVSGGDSKVRVLSTSTFEVIETIDVGSNPRGLAGTPDGSLVFVPNRDDDTVTVIDTSDNSVADTIALTGDQPYNLAVTPDGTTVYVVMKTSDGGSSGTPGVLSVIDVASLTETDSITLVGESPEGLAIAPDGAYVYTVHRNTGTVDVVNTSTGAVEQLAETSSTSPRDAVVIGSKLLVVNDSSSGIDIIDTGTGALTTSIAGGYPRDIAAHPDGLTAYATDMGYSTPGLIVVDVATNTESNTLELTLDASSHTSYGVALDYNGLYAYVTMVDSDSVVVVDLDHDVELGTSIDVVYEPRGVVVVQVPN